MTSSLPAPELSSFWDDLVACGGELSCLLELVTRRAAEIVGEGSVLMLVSEDGTRLEPGATYHADAELADFIGEVVGSGSFAIGEGIAGRVAATRAGVVLNDIAPDLMARLVHPAGRAFAERHPIRALLIVPLVASGELFGTLGVVRVESTLPYETEDVLAVEALAERAALAIADARRQPAVLGPDDFEAIYRYSVDGVLFTIPDGSVLAANPAACEILGLSEAEICRRGRAGLMVADDPATKAAVLERARTGSTRAEVPMRRGNGAHFTAEMSSSIFTTTRGELRACVIFRDVSEQVAIREQLAREAERLEEASEHDALTGLRNRRGFVSAAEEAIAIAARQERDVQLLFFDVDGLKQVNDRYGHSAGDDHLKRFANAVATATRAADVSARLGGDEFVLLLFSASSADADQVVSRIARAFAASGRDPATFSVGVAGKAPASEESLAQLIERADREMYRAKVLRRYAT